MTYKTLVEELREFKGDSVSFALRFDNSICWCDGELEDLALNMAESIECENYPAPRFTDGCIVQLGTKIEYDGQPFNVDMIELSHNSDSLRFRVRTIDYRYTPWLPIDERLERGKPDSSYEITAGVNDGV